MKRGAAKNYKFGPKNNWRRTIWNDVLRRTNGQKLAAQRSPEMARKIAAMLAVRTMRAS